MVSEKSIRPVRAELQEVIARLKGLQSPITVAVSALRHQNAEALLSRLPRPPTTRR